VLERAENPGAVGDYPGTVCIDWRMACTFDAGQDDWFACRGDDSSDVVFSWIAIA